MPRNIDAANIYASGQDVVHPVLMTKLEYDSGNVTINSANFNFISNGDLYYGVGNFGSISPVVENNDRQATNCVLSLSGIDSSLLEQAMAEYYQGRDATVFIALFDDNMQLIGAPTVLYKGVMDTQQIVLGATATINLTVVSKISIFLTPKVRRYNNADQQRYWPSDKGLEFVDRTVNQQIKWGG